jgi:hypothetical protein
MLCKENRLVVVAALAGRIPQDLLALTSSDAIHSQSARARVEAGQHIQ